MNKQEILDELVEQGIGAYILEDFDEQWTTNMDTKTRAWNIKW